MKNSFWILIIFCLLFNFINLNFYLPVRRVCVKNLKYNDLLISNLIRHEKTLHYLKEFGVDKSKYNVVYRILYFNDIEYNIDEKLALNICYHESRFNYKAINWSNRNGTIDIGLFQINSRTYGRGYWKLRDLDTNIKFALKHITWLSKENEGNTEKILESYNAGIGAVRRNQVPRCTKKYVSIVLHRMKEQSNFLKI